MIDIRAKRKLRIGAVRTCRRVRSGASAIQSLAMGVLVAATRKWSWLRQHFARDTLILFALWLLSTLVACFYQMPASTTGGTVAAAALAVFTLAVLVWWWFRGIQPSAPYSADRLLEVLVFAYPCIILMFRLFASRTRLLGPNGARTAILLAAIAIAVFVLLLQINLARCNGWSWLRKTRFGLCLTWASKSPKVSRALSLTRLGVIGVLSLSVSIAFSYLCDVWLERRITEDAKAVLNEMVENRWKLERQMFRLREKLSVYQVSDGSNAVRCLDVIAGITSEKLWAFQAALRHFEAKPTDSPGFSTQKGAHSPNSSPPPASSRPAENSADSTSPDELFFIGAISGSIDWKEIQTKLERMNTASSGASSLKEFAAQVAKRFFPTPENMTLEDVVFLQRVNATRIDVNNEARMVNGEGRPIDRESALANAITYRYLCRNPPDLYKADATTAPLQPGNQGFAFRERCGFAYSPPVTSELVKGIAALVSNGVEEVSRQQLATFFLAQEVASGSDRLLEVGLADNLQEVPEEVRRPVSHFGGQGLKPHDFVSRKLYTPIQKLILDRIEKRSSGDAPFTIGITHTQARAILVGPIQLWIYWWACWAAMQGLVVQARKVDMEVLNEATNLSLERDGDFVKALINYLPDLGFIGTLIGIGKGMSISNKMINADSDTGSSVIATITENLGTAFYTTLVAVIALMMVKVFLATTHRMLNVIDFKPREPVPKAQKILRRYPP